MIIGDSSALIALSVVDKLELLEKLYKNLFVPQAVYDEVTQVGRPQSDKLKRFLQSRVKVVDLNLTKLGLGLGELEAITLYKELDADVLLIDDNRAKKYAVLNDVRVIGSLGILIKAKEKKHIDKIKPLLDEIMKSGVYISNKLIVQVLEICDELEK
jgi:predicted nucleic acid-binding protein